jgi:hypothetical protein
MVDGPSDQPLPEPTLFSAFDHLLDTCRQTHAALVAVVRDQARDGVAVRDLLASEALNHLDAVLEGLLLLTRTGQYSSEELRALVRRAGILEPARPGTAEARAAAREASNEAIQGTADDRRGLRTIDGRTMLAAGHARIVFSVIPSLPAEAISWPWKHRSYADIPVPQSAGELLLRAEELARVVWRVAAGDDRRDEPLRRTLAFYEAGARLSYRGFRAA